MRSISSPSRRPTTSSTPIWMMKTDSEGPLLAPSAKAGAAQSASMAAPQVACRRIEAIRMGTS
jgi:hypothetical protein